MAEYGLIESFGIDDGELDGMSPEQAFCLGVEWQKYYQFAMNHDAGLSLPPGPHLLNSVNLERVLALLHKHSVPFSYRLTHDDWAEISFGESSEEGGDNGQSSA